MRQSDFLSVCGLNIPKREKIVNIDTYHPRICLPPLMFRFLHGFIYAVSILILVKKIQKEFKFDLINAPYLYPDGFAAVLISKIVRKPVIIEARGSDVNLLATLKTRKPLILYACKNASAVVSVSRDMKTKLIGMGILEDKIHVISNGINPDEFKPLNKIECREKLGLPRDKKIVLFVGNIDMAKGIFFLIEAWNYLVKKLDESIILVLVGKGREGNKITQLIEKYGISEYVLVAGEKASSEIAKWMNAADLLCLPSIREGCPNVLLEAIACNKYVVASRVGGIPEIITSGHMGILVEPADSLSLAIGIEKALMELSGKNRTVDAPVFVKPWEEAARERSLLFNKYIMEQSKSSEHYAVY